MKITIQVEPANQAALERAWENWDRRYETAVETGQPCFNRNQYFDYDKDAGVLIYQGERHPLQEDGGLKVVWAALHGDRDLPIRLRPAGEPETLLDKYKKEGYLPSLINVTPDAERWMDACIQACKAPDRFLEGGSPKPDSSLGAVVQTLQVAIQMKLRLDEATAHRFANYFSSIANDAKGYGNSMSEVLTSEQASEHFKRTLLQTAMQVSAAMPDPRVTVETTFKTMPVFGTLDDVQFGDLFWEAGQSNAVFTASVAYKALEACAGAINDVKWQIEHGQVALHNGVFFYSGEGNTPEEIRDLVAEQRSNGIEPRYDYALIADAPLDTLHLIVDKETMKAVLDTPLEIWRPETEYEVENERAICAAKEVLLPPLWIAANDIFDRIDLAWEAILEGEAEDAAMTHNSYGVTMEEAMGLSEKEIEESKSEYHKYRSTVQNVLNRCYEASAAVSDATEDLLSVVPERERGIENTIS